MKLIHGCEVLCVRIGWCAYGMKLAWNISELFEHSCFLQCKIAIGKVIAGFIVRTCFLPRARRALFSSRSGIFIS
jgi:hypothetical protein